MKTEYKMMCSAIQARHDRIYSSSHIMQTVIIYSLANETKITCLPRSKVYYSCVFTVQRSSNETTTMAAAARMHTSTQKKINKYVECLMSSSKEATAALTAHKLKVNGSYKQQGLYWFKSQRQLFFFVSLSLPHISLSLERSCSCTSLSISLSERHIRASYTSFSVQVCLLHFQVMFSLSHSIFPDIRFVASMFDIYVKRKYSHGSQIHSKRMAHPIPCTNSCKFNRTLSLI